MKDLKEFILDAVITVTSFIGGVYFVLWNSNCVRQACLYAVPEWLPRWW